MVISNLQESPYARTDPNVTRYGLRTYVGQAVRRGEEYLGSICAVFQKDAVFSEDEHGVIGLIASALSAEESRKQAEEELRESESRLADIIAFLPDATFAVDMERRIILWNKAIERMTGIPAEEMIGKSNYAYAVPFYGEARPKLVDLVFLDDKEIEARYPEITRNGKYLTTEVFCESLYSNKGAWVFAKASPLHDQFGNITGAIQSIRDITENKRMEAEIYALSITDQLTGLHNRRGFLSLAEQQLKLSERNKRGVQLYFADLDGMKWINDTQGHEEGDKTLIETANIFRETFRSSDIIARLGGDEFAVLAIDTNAENPEISIARLQTLIDTRNNQKNRKNKISISIGYSYYDPENPCSLDELLARADKLMYEEKQNKKGLHQQGNFDASKNL